MNPFDFVNAVTYTKKDIMVDEVRPHSSQRTLTPFLDKERVESV